MPLDAKLGQRLQRALRTADEQGTGGPRLLDDARRLWRRIERLAALKLVGAQIDHDALELAAFALQLPLRRSRKLTTGKAVRAYASRSGRGGGGVDCRTGRR